MKRKIVWLLVSCLIVLSLVMAACAPAAVEEEEEKAPVTEEKAPEQKVEEEVVAPTVEKPKYGGVIKCNFNSDITSFDEVTGSVGYSAVTMQITNEHLWGGDWTKGAAGGYGTNETDWTDRYDVWENDTGYIAESWEIPNKIEGELAAVTYHIRKGIHWALNPASEASRLVGGRELTADDVVFSLKQVITDTRASIYKSEPEIRVTKITSPAPWTVKIEFPWDAFEAAVGRFSDDVRIVPPEVVAKYGTMKDWRVSVGTGAFMLTDVLPGSSATLVRNPSYWMKDPIGPGKGNQLPYLDGVKYFIIPDKSTQYAALRTAKIDWIGGYWARISGDDAAMFKEMTPQLMSKKISTARTDEALALKLDRAPFNDIRVRRALMMAIDFETIKNDYFGGDAQIVVFPIAYLKEYADAYYGPDAQGQWPSDCPESIKELYSYNPEKARKLLAEAGYPQGFKTNIILESKPEHIDYYSIYTDLWSKVGVDCELQPKETGAYSTIKSNRSFDQMMAGVSINTGLIYKMRYYYGPGERNMSGVDDPVVNEAFPKIQRSIVTGRAEANRLHKELMKYVLDQVFVIPRVTPSKYNLWWPWVKNYSGEIEVGFLGSWHRWVWYGQELKKSMGY